MEEGLPVSARELHRAPGAALQRPGDGEHYGPVAVAHIPLGALDGGRSRRRLQFVASVDAAVLSPPPLGAPTTVCDAPGDGKVQRGAVGSGLTAGHDLDVSQCRHGPRCLGIRRMHQTRGDESGPGRFAGQGVDPPFRARARTPSGAGRFTAARRIGRLEVAALHESLWLRVQPFVVYTTKGCTREKPGGCRRELPFRSAGWSSL